MLGCKVAHAVRGWSALHSGWMTLHSGWMTPYRGWMTPLDVPSIRPVKDMTLSNPTPQNDGKASLRPPSDPPSSARRVFRRTSVLVCAFIQLASTACSDTDVRGHYEVEILIEQARAPIAAILLLTSTHLDTDSLPIEAREGIGEGNGSGGDYQEDQADPNSCLILPSNDPSDATPRSVTFFEARFRDGEVVVPFSIFEAQEQRMEVVKLQFFANALGGDIVFHEPDGERPGRLIGDRLGEAVGQQCIAAMHLFYARIQQLIQAE
jgi:hypothetical protein